MLPKAKTAQTYRHIITDASLHLLTSGVSLFDTCQCPEETDKVPCGYCAEQYCNLP